MLHVSNLFTNSYPNLAKIVTRGFVRDNSGKNKSDKNTNVFYIPDIISHVQENYKSNNLIGWNPKFKDTNFKSCKNNDRIIFLGLYDDHEGKIASEFAYITAAYELYNMEEFQDKNYEMALNKLFPQIHDSLLRWPGYVFEFDSVLDDRCEDKNNSVKVHGDKNSIKTYGGRNSKHKSDKTRRDKGRIKRIEIVKAIKRIMVTR